MDEFVIRHRHSVLDVELKQDGSALLALVVKGEVQNFLLTNEERIKLGHYLLGTKPSPTSEWWR